MATSQQIATRALRRLRVIAADETPAASDIDAAGEALNAMIASWEANGLSGDVLPLDARFEQAIVAMLAVRLAEEYGKEPSAVLMRDAVEGEAALVGAFFAVPSATFDAGLVATGHAADGYWQASPTPSSPWVEATEYSVRTFVTNGGSIYECVTGGTSGTSGGPTGTLSVIVDGSVTWCFRRVDGA